MLLIFLGVAVSLDGSQDGIATYLSGDLSVLIDRPEVWAKAVSLLHFDDILHSMATFHPLMIKEIKSYLHESFGMEV